MIKTKFGAGLVASAMILFTATMASAAPGLVTGNANVRAGAGINYPIIGSVQYGQSVDIEFCSPNGKWCHVRKPGKDGWIAAKYLASGQPIDPGYGNGPLPDQGNHHPGQHNHGGHHPGWGHGPSADVCFGDVNATICLGF